MRTRVLFVLVAAGLATSVSAQQPVITSFEADGTITWSNAYSNAWASIDRLSDVTTTGSAVTVTETLGTSDGSTAFFSYIVEHPPIVNPSVTISDGIHSWNDVTLSSTNPPVLWGVVDYSAGAVSATHFSQVPPAGTPIEVEYSYLPVSTTQEWLSVYAEQVTSEVSQASVDMNEDTGLFRVRNVPSAPMVLIPGGANSGTDPDFGTYTLTVESFYMDQYEVTKALWDEVKTWNGGNGYDLAGVGSGKALDHPVQTVSWYDCVKWCNARSEKEGRMPAYYTDAGFTHVYKTGQELEPYVEDSANGYRLPTDEQWLYAARGGVSSRRFPWGGDTIDHERANYDSRWQDGAPYHSYDEAVTGGIHPDWDDDPQPYTSPVGTFEAGKNGYGLYDMSGNVLEWCYDWYPGLEGSIRVYHGGSWGSYANLCRVGYRDAGWIPDGRGLGVGFRAVRPPGQQ